MPTGSGIGRSDATARPQTETAGMFNAAAYRRALRDLEELDVSELLRFKLRALYAAFMRPRKPKGVTVKKAKPKDDTIEITFKLRGQPSAVVHAMAYGLPLEALAGIRDGMTREIERRIVEVKEAPRRRPAKRRARK